jgi:hypothetical protein
MSTKGDQHTHGAWLDLHALSITTERATIRLDQPAAEVEIMHDETAPSESTGAVAHENIPLHPPLLIEAAFQAVKRRSTTSWLGE